MHDAQIGYGAINHPVDRDQYVDIMELLMMFAQNVEEVKRSMKS